MNTEPLFDLIVGRGFEKFQSGLQSRFKAHHLEYEYKYCDPTDNPALTIDFSTNHFMGRMTAWTAGSSYLEVLNCASGKTVFDKHYEIKAESDFHSQLAELALYILNAEQDAAANP